MEKLSPRQGGYVTSKCAEAGVASSSSSTGSSSFEKPKNWTTEEVVVVEDGMARDE